MKRLTGLFLVICIAMPARAQNAEVTGSFRVFLDCQYFCDTQYITEKLPIVDFVTERTAADVHILYARQTTAAGGAFITLTFMGQRSFSALSDTLTYTTNSDATPDERRSALLHHVTIGLTRYLAHAGLAEKLVIRAVIPKKNVRQEASIEKDRWNYWVFSISGNGSVSGQETTKFVRKRGSVSANRTTEALKIRFSASANENTSEFDVGDETIESSTSSESASVSVVKSIGEKWAVGLDSRISSSSFKNTKLQMNIGPAIEFDFFPYSMSTRKMLTAKYRVQFQKRKYEQLTIFALDKEDVLSHSFSLNLSLKQKWGSVSVSTSINQLLTNFDRSLTDSYNFGVFAFGNVRLFRGLSFNTFASYNRIRDQIDLPGDAATKEEILLRSIQLPTGYSYRVNFGFTYRFGSIYNNVVNPRMGGGGGNMIIVM